MKFNSYYTNSKNLDEAIIDRIITRNPAALTEDEFEDLYNLTSEFMYDMVESVTFGIDDEDLYEEYLKRSKAHWVE